MKLRQTLCATLAALVPLGTLTLAPGAVQAQPSARDGQPAAAPATTTPRTARYCTNCATVEAVRVIASGDTRAAGTAGGERNVAGSSGTGATAAGAAAGAGLDTRRAQRYEVVVRYAGNGAAQTLQYDNDPGFRVGDAVRVNKGVLSRDQ